MAREQKRKPQSKSTSSAAELPHEAEVPPGDLGLQLSNSERQDYLSMASSNRRLLAKLRLDQAATALGADVFGLLGEDPVSLVA